MELRISKTNKSMSEFKSFRKESKKDFGLFQNINDNLNIEHIKIGCLLRIADAAENIAINYTKLQNDYNYVKERKDYYQEKYYEMQRKVSALKGVITKMRKSIK